MSKATSAVSSSCAADSEAGTGTPMCCKAAKLSLERGLGRCERKRSADLARAYRLDLAIARRRVGDERVDQLARRCARPCPPPDRRRLDWPSTACVNPLSLRTNCKRGQVDLLVRGGWLEIMQRLDVSAHDQILTEMAGICQKVAYGSEREQDVAVLLETRSAWSRSALRSSTSSSPMERRCCGRKCRARRAARA